jgi:catechol 2,3-dioxygenase-like lactoylglutathione lyase family enzyme
VSRTADRLRSPGGGRPARERQRARGHARGHRDAAGGWVRIPGSALELAKSRSPSYEGDDEPAPPNAPGIRHILFVVDDIQASLAGLQTHGGELVGELVNYENSYWLCYVRGPAGIIVELAERIG